VGIPPAATILFLAPSVNLRAQTLSLGIFNILLSSVIVPTTAKIGSEFLMLLYITFLLIVWYGIWKRSVIVLRWRLGLCMFCYSLNVLELICW
jgi:hypothetical protein